MQIHKLGLGIAFAVALGVAAPSLAQQAVQWRVEDGGNGHWYQLRLVANADWEQLRLESTALGGHLATVTSPAENDFLFELLTPASESAFELVFGPFIGGFQDPQSPTFVEPEGGWRWVTDEAWTFSAWHAGEPNNTADTPRGIQPENYLQLARWNAGRWWNDINNPPIGVLGYLSRGGIFEWSADCNNDGIVDYGQILDGTFEDSDRNGVPDCCDQGAVCQPNLLTNGGFEVGPNQPDCAWVVYGASASFVPGWSVVAVNVDRVRLNASCPPSTESWTSYQGEYTVDLDGSAAGGAVSQTIATVPGREYALSFQLTGNGNSGQRPMRVEIGSSQWQFVHICQPTNPQPWSEKSVEFVAASDSTTIVLRSLMASGRNGPVIDAARLVELIDPCPSDIDENGVTDAIDLAIILGRWGTNPKDYPRADANDDGTVDANDLAIVLSGWGNCP